MAWHNHDTANPDHVVVLPTGELRRYTIQTPGHDGWDNTLAFDAAGRLPAHSSTPRATTGSGRRRSLSREGRGAASRRWPSTTGIGRTSPTATAASCDMLGNRSASGSASLCSTTGSPGPTRDWSFCGSTRRKNRRGLLGRADRGRRRPVRPWQRQRGRGAKHCRLHLPLELPVRRGTVDISDAIMVLLHLFGGGGPLPAPFPACGEDPTPDALGCNESPSCM